MAILFIRYIPLFNTLADLLSKITKKKEFVFPYSDNQVRCNFKRFKTKYGLDFRIHDLRHTFATRCIENGISTNTVSKWLGHSKVSTTSDIYTHVQTDFEREQIAKYNLKMKG